MYPVNSRSLADHPRDIGVEERGSARIAADSRQDPVGEGNSVGGIRRVDRHARNILERSDRQLDEAGRKDVSPDGGPDSGAGHGV